MGEIVPFKRRKASEKHKGNILCKRNFHKWEVLKERQFDVKEGRLVTVYRCRRCGTTKVEAR